MKLKPVGNDAGTVTGFSFRCPGCDEHHVFYTAGSMVWAFDGNRESPTFLPSLVNTWPHGRDASGTLERCHLNLTAGRLMFHPDSTHKLAGQTVDLPDVPVHPWESEP